MRPTQTPLVSTIPERCRLCYTCVRECPAKAIRVSSGQAEVLKDRCIGCGNCVRVCSQGAKQVYDEIELVESLLDDHRPVAALIAPSFPAEFTEYDYETLVGMIRGLGFDRVHEVGFGADLVAEAYWRLLSEGHEQRYIATTCPAIVGYVERYCPDLVPHLAPIVSPMIAAARALRRLYGPEWHMVFIGPCIAKKGEALSPRVEGEIDGVLTFIELREMFWRRAIKPEAMTPADFDPPHASTGMLFSLSRGLLQAAQLHEDLLTSEVVVADGRSEFVQVIREFENGDLDARLLEVLCCKGCIMGSGMSTHDPLFKRRAQISRYARERMALDVVRWYDHWCQLQDVDLSRTFDGQDQRIALPSQEQLRDILRRMGKYQPEDELNCGACGYESCLEHAVAIYKGLAEHEMCLPHTIEQLRATCRQLAISHHQLASTQEALMQSEKLASMGQLAAGIAHEVNNPLGTVLMLSHVLLQETPSGSPVHDDLNMIVAEADRCKKIVAGLLHFARKNKVDARQVDLVALVQQAIQPLSLPNVVIEIQACGSCLVELDADQIMQVLNNLINNALAAMPQGGRLVIGIAEDEERVRLWVQDSGTGILPEIRSKIFEPFFTTKQAGEGTGLGLSVSYGIIKMHHGDIQLISNHDPQAGPTGSTFTVTLPRRRPAISPAEYEPSAPDKPQGTEHEAG
ncbi:MAG: Adaptive-response sensory-kinase SasA [Phycisphaerae bacterium]|nr:Adaptive-response sensory-kinase SasA [Phycisphaerae bacterium]